MLRQQVVVIIRRGGVDRTATAATSRTTARLASSSCSYSNSRQLLLLRQRQQQQQLFPAVFLPSSSSAIIRHRAGFITNAATRSFATTTTRTTNPTTTTTTTTSDPSSTASTTTDKGKCQCQIRVADQWLTWEEGKIIVFDDSYEHEVINSTNSIRVVLLFRFWHPSLLTQEKRHDALELALKSKRKESLRRYNPPPPLPPSCHRLRSSLSVELRAMEESSCPNCWNTGYEYIRVVPTDNTAATASNADNDYSFACSCGQPI